jgi:hypothetical protein
VVEDGRLIGTSPRRTSRAKQRTPSGADGRRDLAVVPEGADVAKLIYRPFGLLFRLLGGLVARLLRVEVRRRHEPVRPDDRLEDDRLAVRLPRGLVDDDPLAGDGFSITLPA